MNRGEPRIEFVKGYSVALLCLGVFLLLGALQFQLAPKAAEDSSFSIFISSILYLLGFSCLAVSLLRWTRASAALPARSALSLCLLLAFPFGTGLSIYWLARVKPRETISQGVSERIWYNYTVTLKAASDLDHEDIQALVKAAIEHSGVIFPRTRSTRMVIKSESKKRRPRRTRHA